MQKKDDFFSKDNETFQGRDVSRMRDLARGLTYVSESDFPIDVFLSEKASAVTVDDVIAMAGRKSSEVVEEISLSDFFEKLTTVHDWYGPKEKDRCERFRKLQEYLEQVLKDLHVFRIGKIQIDIYIVGLTGDGRLAGLKTKAVET
jgi:nuclease A inhibitor-like protein